MTNFVNFFSSASNHGREAAQPVPPGPDEGAGAAARQGVLGDDEEAGGAGAGGDQRSQGKGQGRDPEVSQVERERKFLKLFPGPSLRTRREGKSPFEHIHYSKSPRPRNEVGCSCSARNQLAREGGPAGGGEGGNWQSFGDVHLCREKFDSERFSEARSLASLLLGWILLFSNFCVSIFRHKKEKRSFIVKRACEERRKLNELHEKKMAEMKKSHDEMKKALMSEMAMIEIGESNFIFFRSDDRQIKCLRH